MKENTGDEVLRKSTWLHANKTSEETKAYGEQRQKVRMEEDSNTSANMVIQNEK